jgi:hypothetical protein
MHTRLSTNLSFRRFDLFAGPPLHRLPPEKPHLFEKPLFGRVGPLEISLRILYGADYRDDSISKLRVLDEKRQLKWTPFVGPRTVRIKVEVACSFLFSSSSKTL